MMINAVAIRAIAATMEREPDRHLAATWRTLARHRGNGFDHHSAMRLLSNNVRDYERDIGVTLQPMERKAIASSLLTRWLRTPNAIQTATATE